MTRTILKLACLVRWKIAYIRWMFHCGYWYRDAFSGKLGTGDNLRCNLKILRERHAASEPIKQEFLKGVFSK